MTEYPGSRWQQPGLSPEVGAQYFDGQFGNPGGEVRDPAAIQGQNEAVEEFVNERIRRIVGELKGGADRSAAINQLERVLTDTIEDRSSPLIFPDRVVDNSRDNLKKRAGGAKVGRATFSRTYVAEIAADILSVTFKVRDANSLPIEIDMRDGTVATGQHRAAALMLLYGENWIEQGWRLGFEITSR